MAQKKDRKGGENGEKNSLLIMRTWRFFCWGNVHQIKSFWIESSIHGTFSKILLAIRPVLQAFYDILTIWNKVSSDGESMFKSHHCHWTTARGVPIWMWIHVTCLNPSSNTKHQSETQVYPTACKIPLPLANPTLVFFPNKNLASFRPFCRFFRGSWIFLKHTHLVGGFNFQPICPKRECK